MPKILVADDSIAVRKVAERLLTEAGLGVTLAANGEEALACLAKERPDVIVSDVIMPDKSGYEVCAFVRGQASLAATPVLLISGIVNDEVTKQAESCRANGVLKKPFQGTSLKDRVLELLTKRQESVANPVSKPDTAQAVESLHDDARFAREQQELARLASTKLKEVEEHLRVERARTEELAKRVASAAEQITRVKEIERQLTAERQRVAELEAKIVKLEQQLTKLPDLESALQSERDTVDRLKREVQSRQDASGRLAELESALTTEREAAEQLVQQLSDLEQVSMKLKDAESRCAEEARRAEQFQQQSAGLEAALAVEHEKVADLSRQLEEAHTDATKVQELEKLIATERDRNGILTRRVADAEQAAEGATRRFEEMARKLAEIAGLASQLGNGKG